MNHDQQPTDFARGILADEDIPPTAEMKRITIGPFPVGASPRLQTRLVGEDPKGSLVHHQVRLDQDDGYVLVYNIQNYGTKTVRMTIRRLPS